MKEANTENVRFKKKQSYFGILFCKHMHFDKVKPTFLEEPGSHRSPQQHEAIIYLHALNEDATWNEVSVAYLRVPRQ